jgi:hypothetical protein
MWNARCDLDHIRHFRTCRSNRTILECSILVSSINDFICCGFLIIITNAVLRDGRGDLLRHRHGLVSVREQCPCFQELRVIPAKLVPSKVGSGSPGQRQDRAARLDSRFRGNDEGERNQLTALKKFSDGP